MPLQNLLGQLSPQGLIINQLVDHRGLVEIYVHLTASSFLFLASLVAAFSLWRSFKHQAHGWFLLRFGVVFLGFVGLGEAAEHFGGQAQYHFFHYLHMVASPMSLLFLYSAVRELNFFYLDLQPKKLISQANSYLTALSSLIIAFVLGVQIGPTSKIIELPFLTLTMLPTVVLAYLLVKESIKLYQKQQRLSLFNLSLFSTTFGLLPLLSLGAVMLATSIWLGRLADNYQWVLGYIIFHVTQDMWHAGLGATLMGSALILYLLPEQQEVHKRLLRSAKLVAIGEMAADIASQLNQTLLTVLSHSTLVLEDKKLPINERHELEVIQTEAEKAVKLAKDLLDYSSNLAPKFQAVDVETILEASLRLTSPRLVKAGISVIKSYDRPLPLISADVDQIKQVFIGIINNAADSMSTGGRLEIVAAKKGSFVEVAFTDTGPGMAKEQLSQVFQPLYSTKSDKGTGIGLALAQSIIRQHRGSISVDSYPEYGTTVIVTLPAVSDEDIFADLSSSVKFAENSHP